MTTARRPRIALVLSGGGARGAYEAGVIRFIRERLPAKLGRHAHFDIITGTSVGAINASYLAGTADRPELQAAALCTAWRSLEIEELISLRTRDLVRATRLLMGADPPPPTPGSYRYGGLLETGGLERFVLKTIPWHGIRRNLHNGTLSALAVAATHVGSGHTVVFIDSAKPLPERWSSDPFVSHRAAHIGPRYALASAAIPMLFPAVKIGRSFYVDGGLRLNTPMSPAIRLGADRILVISLRHVPGARDPLEHDREIAYPKPLFLAGKALNALMLDHTDYDIDRLSRINAIIAAGTAAFGPRFDDVLNRELLRLRGAPVRPLQALHIRPSEDVGAIASTFMHEGRIKLRGRMARRLFRRLSRGEANRESDFLSYLLFDGGFAEALLELGYRDAEAREDELLDLFEVSETSVAATGE
jgi:NTE family protein